jgi:hypothetical protein
MRRHPRQRLTDIITIPRRDDRAGYCTGQPAERFCVEKQTVHVEDNGG